ncbi:MAG: hypothetical protein DBX55_06385 [Verrucomicrobia bacterium]|nr:MAG: hypothetical protein DBX55_06385 [Verrucomicrobiota bacterium]
MKKPISILILAGAAFLPSVLPAQVDSSGFVPAHIRPGSTADYTVTLKDISGRVSPSDIPIPSGLQIVGQRSGQNIIVNNSEMSRSTSYTFTILAGKEGTYTIPEWKIKLGGQEYAIPASALKVSADAPQAPAIPDDDAFASPMQTMFRQRQIRQRQQQHSFDASLRDKISLELKLPKEKIYVGESVPCRLVFSMDKSLPENGLQLQQFIPQPKEADAFECTPLGKPSEELSADSQKIQLAYDMIITPLKAGTYSLEFSAEGIFMRSVSINDMMSMSFGDMFPSFGMRQPLKFEVATPDAKIGVLPLPDEGKPENFGGAIGKFSLGKASLDTDALTVGDPCIITVPVVGSGNFARIGAPTVESSPDWKTYKPKSSFTDESNGMGYIGVKTFNFSVVPQKADLKTAPTVTFSYFDPLDSKYVTLKTPAMEVSVAPSGRSRRIEKEAQNSNEPAFERIVEAPQNTSATAYGLLSSGIFWGTQAAALAAIAFFVVSRRRKLRLESDPAFAKFIRCMREADAKLKAAGTGADAGNAGAFFKAAKECLQYSLAARSDLDPRAMLSKEAEKILAQRGADESALNACARIFEGADAADFAPVDLSASDLKSLFGELKKINAAARKSQN